jgi:PAS domain S-box-containing protein
VAPERVVGRLAIGFLVYAGSIVTGREERVVGAFQEELPGLGALHRAPQDAVIVCNAAGTITIWNDAATDLLGWAAGEIVGESLDVIIPPRFRARHWAGFHASVERGHSDYAARLLEVPALHRDGRTVSIAFRITFVRRCGDPEILGVAAVVRDGTELWAARQRAAGRA